MPRTKVRVTGIIIKNHKLLLIHRFKKGSEYWVFPGGGVEENETVEEGLKREILEETSLDLISYQLLDEGESSFGDKVLFYSCTLKDGEPILGGPEAEIQNRDNQFHLEYVDLDIVPTITDIYPKPSQAIMDFLRQQN